MMGAHRILGAICLLVLLLSAASADSLDSHAMPSERFRGWVTLQTDITDSHIRQIWRQPIQNLPKGSDGYAMVSYQVESVDTAAQATRRVQGLLQKQRFNEYIAKGYTVTANPWVVMSQHGMLFSVNGLSHTTDAVTAHRADIYTLAFSQETYTIWLEVRVSCTASELDLTDRTIQKANGPTLAEEMATRVVRYWHLGVPEEAATPTPTPPEQPKTETAVPAPAEPTTQETPKAAPVEEPKAEAPATPVPAPAVTVDKPAEAATPSTIPAEAAKPETSSAPPTAPETQPAEPVQPATPADPVVKPAEPETPATPPAPAAATPPTAPVVETPAAPEPPRWTTADGTLSLVMPAGWTAAEKGVITITTPLTATIRLYPPDTYTTDADLTAILDDFVATQRDVSTARFTQQALVINGAKGMLVSYTDFAQQTMYVYCLGKAGRAWRLQVTLPGDAKPLPAEIRALADSLRLQ